MWMTTEYYGWQWNSTIIICEGRMIEFSCLFHQLLDDSDELLNAIPVISSSIMELSWWMMMMGRWLNILGSFSQKGISHQEQRHFTIICVLVMRHKSFSDEMTTIFQALGISWDRCAFWGSSKKPRATRRSIVSMWLAHAISVFFLTAPGGSRAVSGSIFRICCGWSVCVPQTGEEEGGAVDSVHSGNLTKGKSSSLKRNVIKIINGRCSMAKDR